MEPFSGLVVVAGVAGLTKALSSNTERIVEALERRLDHESASLPDRVVIVENVQIERASDQALHSR